MNSDFDETLRRRFAAAQPIVADEGFVLRVGDALRRRRRLTELLAVLGVVALGVLVAIVLPLLAPVFDLVQRGATALAVLAGEAQTSLVAAVLMGALVVVGATLSWTLRRL
jgi:hypothetical protein